VLKKYNKKHFMGLRIDQVSQQNHFQISAQIAVLLEMSFPSEVEEIKFDLSINIF
jgi:hypothetical protein